MNKPRRKWTADDVALLKQQYPIERTVDLALIFKCEVEAVYRKAMDLGLRKGEEFLATDKCGRIFKGGTLGQATQFKPNQTPWNAGKSCQAGGRSAETQFKPGQAPATTMPVGSYRIVVNKRIKGFQQLERKTSEAKGANHMRWTPVARLVWEAAHGPVPDGSVVVFKPGQRTVVLEEITLDRVECITRKELARRNHPNSTNPELAKLVQLKGAITRQVNRITREQEGRTTP